MDDSRVPSDPPMPPGPVSRRTFVATTLASGFALAVRPVSAATITTDAAGLVAGAVPIAVADGTISAYRAYPASGGPFPTILVIHEVFGVHEWVKDICRRLAHAGYFAVAPQLYARHGDAAAAPDMAAVMALVRKVPDAEVAADLDATAAWAATTSKADTRRLGVTGFCWGGRQTWLYAAHAPALKAAVAWYGPLDYAHDAQHPANPPDLIAPLRVPVLGLYGAADHNIPKSEVEAFAAALRDAHKACDFVIYPGAGHGFAADYRPSYNEAAATDGWRRMLAWFKTHGVA